jgi:hypothetical protein
MPSRAARSALFLIALMTLGGLCACSPTLPSREPDIRGTITSIVRSGNQGTMRIEAEPGATGDAKAAVTITAATTLLRAVDGASPEPITLDDIAEGMSADAWFTGPVAESYPVQATGEAILVSE